MKLVKLKEIVDFAMQQERHPETINVVITAELPYMTAGQKPYVGVKYAAMGFDWEAGQFRITPEEKVMACKHDGPQTVVEWRGMYCCPKCETTLSKNRKNWDIKYCYKCGRAVKWE